MKTDRRGYFRQIPIYLGKFFRMFVYMDDWKMVPMAALIAGLVSFAVGKDLFVSMEGTLKGSLALTCVCIWNGFFNSIQSVCRERQIVKREHRAGMKITSYITAHMIYQAFLCLMQALITLAVCRITKIHMPSSGLITPFFYVDITIAFFLLCRHDLAPDFMHGQEHDGGNDRDALHPDLRTPVLRRSVRTDSDNGSNLILHDCKVGHVRYMRARRLQLTAHDLDLEADIEAAGL